MVPTKPLEIQAEEAIRTISADGGEEESARVTEHEDSHQDVAPRRGAVSCRPGCWALDELLVLRVVSILAGTPCLAYLGYHKTLPANSQTLPNTS